MLQQATALSLAIQALQFIELPELREDTDLYEEVKRFEIALIERALWRSAGSQTKAARFLGLKLSTLNSKVKAYNLQTSRFTGG
ncbi:MAG TPA: helix-turn-helix domain-containing protein [Pyrinomonadaceae bacterium]|nr:helix-turn-helix domain-containing protein [Pyrinomonadaceae bacterium]